MIFGRKSRAAHVVDVAETVDAEFVDEREESEEPTPDPDEATEMAEDALADDDADADAEDDDDSDDDTADDAADEDGDVREDGPFDISEVDISSDPVATWDPNTGGFSVDAVDDEGVVRATRLSLGPLTISPFPGMGLQLHGDPESNTVYSALIMFENSGLQLELFAAPSTGGLADELREDVIEETQQAGGNAEVVDGPFGQEVRRVLPMEGPEGEQLFHVSRLWLVGGPRWVLRGTLMGQASLVEGEAPPADVFAEFFRNIVVHRDDSPQVPGELLNLVAPDLAAPDAHVEG